MPNPTDSLATRFESFVSRVIESGLAARSDLVGCAHDDIARIERKYQILLPTSYRLFLQTMGRRSGLLFAHDHVSVSFDDVLRMTEQQIAWWRDIPPPETVLFPADVLVILSRLGEQWLCVRCTGGENSPVLYYNEDGGEMQMEHPSVLDWLETWRAEAEEALRGGYFDIYPYGTA